MKREDSIFTSKEISGRLMGCCLAAKINTIGELLDYNTGDLMKFRGFGRTTLAEVEIIRGMVYSSCVVPIAVNVGNARITARLTNKEARELYNQLKEYFT